MLPCVTLYHSTIKSKKVISLVLQRIKQFNLFKFFKIVPFILSFSLFQSRVLSTGLQVHETYLTDALRPFHDKMVMMYSAMKVSIETGQSMEVHRLILGFQFSVYCNVSVSLDSLKRHKRDILSWVELSRLCWCGLLCAHNVETTSFWRQKDARCVRTELSWVDYVG